MKLLRFVAVIGCLLSAATSSTAACLTGGNQTTINNRLNSTGVAELCQSAVFNLTGPVVFSANNQRIFTTGFPTGTTRAKLVVNSSSLLTAINGIRRSGVKIQNIIVDGKAPVLGKMQGGDALIRVGGVGGNNVEVGFVKAFEPRGFSTIHVLAGGLSPCTGAWVHHNTVGPSGIPYTQASLLWADGITIACSNSIVENNTVVDTTDGGIVIFGAAGSKIRNNVVRANTRALLGGINLVDPGHNYAGTVVQNNTVRTGGKRIKIGIGMGPRVWLPCGETSVISGAQVLNNTLAGFLMGYGYAVDGVSSWTVQGNVSTATHEGNTSIGCEGVAPDRPSDFQKHGVHASGSFQDEFQEVFSHLHAALSFVN